MSTFKLTDEPTFNEFNVFRPSRMAVLSNIKENLSTRNVLSNPLYRNMDIKRIADKQFKHEIVSASQPAVRHIFTPAIVVTNGKIIKAISNSNFRNCTLHQYGNESRSHYDHFFKSTGRLSDICTLLSKDIVGLSFDPDKQSCYDITYTSNIDKSNNNNIDFITAFIDIRPGSNVSLYEQFPDDSMTKMIKLVYIVRQNSKLNLERIFIKSKTNNMQLVDTEIIQHPNSSVSVSTNNSGSYYLQDIYNFTIYQECNTEFNGRYELYNNHSNHVLTNIHHIGANSKSTVNVKSTVDDSATSSFLGNIKIDKAATGVDADLQNKNLQLSNSTKITTEPRLDIETKEVVCKHGCTVSGIDPEQLYLLASRGIDSARAKEILAHCFLKGVIHV